MKESTQPLYLEGYHRPDYEDKDDAVYDAISDLMSEGRTSRLYRALVRDKKIASFSAGFTGLPGIKYPHLFAYYAFPLPGHGTREVGEAIHIEIERLQKEDISDDELTFIQELSAFVPTPRSAKRFANTYRLVRVLPKPPLSTRFARAWSGWSGRPG